MRRSIPLPFLVVSLLGTLVTATSSAQVTSAIGFTTTFPFTVGNASFPAGSYTVKPVENTTAVLEITASAGAHSAFFDVEAASQKQAPGKSEVVFQRYGDHYVLKSLCDESDGSATVNTAHGERQRAAQGGTPTEHRVTASKNGKS